MSLRPIPTFVAALFGVVAASALAQPFDSRWGPAPSGGNWPDSGTPFVREGKVDTVHVLGTSSHIAELGSGAVRIVAAPSALSSRSEEASVSAALADELSRAGYRTDTADASAAQVVEFAVSHRQVTPSEPPQGPVSGYMGVGIDSRGGTDVGIGIDVHSPHKPLISTRLDARIFDSESHELLWQGYAEMVTRQGNRHWDDRTIAARLAASLFKGFPAAG